MVSFFIALFLLLQILGLSTLGSAAMLIFVYYLLEFIRKTNECIAMREFIMLLFSLNYLFSPALMYLGLEKYQYYGMKMEQNAYFTLALPSVFLLHKGLYFYKTRIFYPNLRMYRMNASVNEEHIKWWVIGGVVISYFSAFLPSDLGFFAYMLSSIRYVGAFSMLILDTRKYKSYMMGVLVYELYRSLRHGMFHDFVIWIVFLFLLIAYIYKPSLQHKAVTLVLGVLFVFILQLTKGEYRSRLVSEEAIGIETFAESVNSITQNNKEGIFTKENVASSLTRANQAWIFASTVNHMDQTKDFQSFGLLGTYAEAALLPRIIAPNKLKAGDRTLFNRFSGKFLSESTSMGLGLLADGYISFGTVGVWAFALAFGLIFSLIFRIVEYWTNTSAMFAFFFFPLLNYAVRPDCGTQTIMGHLVKGILVFTGVIVFYNWYERDKLDYVKAMAYKRGIPAFNVS
jgi:hypothetical protein